MRTTPDLREKAKTQHEQANERLGGSWSENVLKFQKTFDLQVLLFFYTKRKEGAVRPSSPPPAPLTLPTSEDLPLYRTIE